MCERLEGTVAALGAAVASLDPASLSALRATELHEVFARAERLAVAGRTLAAAAIARTSAWRSAGHKTMAHYLASRTGTSLAAAVETVQTARGVDALPATRQALVSGELSAAQAAAVVAGAGADPSAEARLLAAASRESVSELRQRSLMVRAAAPGGEDRLEAIRNTRYLRHWSDADGALRLDGRFAPDDGARLVSVLSARVDALAQQARRAGRPERQEALAADALVSLASGEAGPRPVLSVHVDVAAYERGHLRPGEACEIQGIGPISVGAARRFGAEGSVALIEAAGTDVARVAHLGRTIPSRLASALEARDRTCVVVGCGVRRGLEYDHIVAYAAGGRTSLSNLARLCKHHHYLKTHRRWHLVGAHGAWELVPPSRAP